MWTLVSCSSVNEALLPANAEAQLQKWSKNPRQVQRSLASPRIDGRTFAPEFGDDLNLTNDGLIELRQVFSRDLQLPVPRSASSLDGYRAAKAESTANRVTKPA
jgi:hypothetical protein